MRFLRFITCIVLFGGSNLLGFSYIVHAEGGNTINEQKSKILQEVYMNPEYMALIDIEKAEVTLSDLARSFEKIEDEYEVFNEERGEIESKYGNVQLAIELILKDTVRTKMLVVDTMTKISLMKKKISDLKNQIGILQEDVKKSGDDLVSYTKFLYRLYNRYYGRSTTINDVQLLIQSDNIAETLSTTDMVGILTQQLQTLLETMKKRQLGYAQKIQEINKAQIAYNQAAKALDEDLAMLEEQKVNLYELLSYLQVRKSKADDTLSDLRSSQDQLQQQLVAIKRISNGVDANSAQEGTAVAQLLEIQDIEESDTYFTRPVIGSPYIDRYFHDEYYFETQGEHYEGVRFETAQRTPIYASAPGVVYKVIQPEGLELSWVVVLHKFGYTTFYSPLNEIYVEEGTLVHRGEIIGLSGGQPGTKGAGLDSLGPYLEFSVMKNGEPTDPLLLMDISIYETKKTLPDMYSTKRSKNLFDRDVPMDTLKIMKGETIAQRRDDFLSTYASGPFADPSLWIDAAQQSGIDPIFGMCIGFAETSFKNFKTVNNIGNVGNDDRGRTREFESPLAGAKALFGVFNNKYLGGYYSLNELSRFGNRDGFIYASSPYNRQKNIMHCLSGIYGYRVQQDFPFRRRQK